MSAGGKPSYVTRFSYATSDVAGQLLFCWVMWYLPAFLTKQAGIAALTVGTIVGMARWIDAIDAPVWGLIFDRTRSRWGKSRPWFLWLSGPFAIFGVLTFMVPDLSHGAKIAYAAITYIGCNVLYTGINTPVTAILSALTSDPREREVLTTFRMVGSKLGVLAVNLVGLELVRVLGQGNDKRGFMLAVPLFAALSWALFLVAFRNLKETLPVESKPVPLRDTFGALNGNYPWVIIFVSSFLFWVGFIARATITPLFFGDALGRPDLVKFANALDFASLGTALLLPWLCRTTSKTTVWLLGLAGMVLGQVVVWLGIAQGHSLNLIMAGWALGFVASGAAMAMPFAVLSDSVDFGEWKTGIRAVGLLTAVGAAFCLKAGAGLGGALPMWVIGAAGYISTEAGQPAVVQPAAALRALDFCVSWLPGIALAAALVPVFFYRKYERLEPQVQADLAARRAKS